MSLLRGIARTAVGSAARRGARHTARRNRSAYGEPGHSRGADILGIVAGAVAARIATRSVPGALLVGGGLVAKYLWDKHRDREAAQDVPVAESIGPDDAEAGDDTPAPPGA